MRTSPYSPQLNGIAERKNRTLTDLVNAMLDTAELSKESWGEAILTVCHVLNRVPIKKDNTIRGMGEENANTFMLTYIELFGKNGCDNNQEI